MRISEIERNIFEHRQDDLDVYGEWVEDNLIRLNNSIGLDGSPLEELCNEFLRLKSCAIREELFIDDTYLQQRFKETLASLIAEGGSRYLNESNNNYM